MELLDYVILSPFALRIIVSLTVGQVNTIILQWFEKHLRSYIESIKIKATELLVQARLDLFVVRSHGNSISDTSRALEGGRWAEAQSGNVIVNIALIKEHYLDFYCTSARKHLHLK